MKVIRAKSAGFCWGVERAIKIAENYAEKNSGKVLTDGPLIHNSQMMEKLEKSGVREVGDYTSEKELQLSEEDKKSSVLVVRAHGISPERRKYLKNLGMEFRDATCPDVGVIAGRIKAGARKGKNTVVFGDPKHPEVIGLLGYAGGRGYVVQNEEDIEALPEMEGGVAMVSQSTMFVHEFQRLSDLLREKYPEAEIYDTICGATKERQTDLRKLVQQGAEAIIVIGGHHSANTRKLAKLAMEHDRPTYHIETAEQINPQIMSQYQTVGVTAGASTPDFIIDSVCKTLRGIEPVPAEA
ncbi:4-hydroxy-3-methylbut-2-enyl diphosphate reductase [Puniceicoccus vermicola]|uniref:4-hydroxy-3-methylbut-2-enyl diphosphate reductase n=1 Tax=Puniceicoccus vermicola TaxID=388746 RepID=A0A7X1B263_9BACT|nr:4-hydroxy-3-methylbut-2-enyl diphosphate reductase [Puniceicoccus vermicola]MBC2604142.1 4-hydroxy-3-methylbut-2-enyl diphosphate reductase [Puniceicoccus vermicola]